MAFQQGLELVPAICSFSSSCPVPRLAVVTSLLLTRETIHPGTVLPSACPLRGQELMPWSHSSLSGSTPVLGHTWGAEKPSIGNASGPSS